MNNVLLISLAVFAIIFLSGWYIWNVIFFRSWRKLFFMFLGVFLESTKRVDEYKPIPPSTRVPKSDGMKAQAEALDFDVALEQARPVKPQQSILPEIEDVPEPEVSPEDSRPFLAVHLDTIDEPEVSPEDSRPFLAVHLETDNDDDPENNQ